MLATILPLLIAILNAAPQVIKEVESIWATLSAQVAPTPDQQAAMDAALDDAHKALQDS